MFPARIYIYTFRLSSAELLIIFYIIHNFHGLLSSRFDLYQWKFPFQSWRCAFIHSSMNNIASGPSRSLNSSKYMHLIESTSKSTSYSFRNCLLYILQYHQSTFPRSNTRICNIFTYVCCTRSNSPDTPLAALFAGFPPQGEEEPPWSILVNAGTGRRQIRGFEIAVSKSL